MIYLDSAATTLQKPPAVAAAVSKALTELSSPGRGGHSAAMAAADTAFRCRCALAELFGMDHPERVVFTMNATHSLNLAIKSLIGPGDRVVISGYEHNSVTRPLTALGAKVEVARFPLFQEGDALAAFERLAVEGTRAVVCTHVSNVFGFILPVEAIAALCRERGIPLILDLSQSAGTIPVNFQALGAAFAAMPGHKGLYGPQGTGVLLWDGKAPVKTLLEGGTGSVSLEQNMPEELPDRLEAGTHNMPGIAGLLEGVQFVRQRGPEAICSQERRLALLAAKGLEAMPGVRVFSLSGLRSQGPVLSFTTEKLDGETLAQTLAEEGVAVRAGLHCAPLAHGTAGTLNSGTVRMSFSAFNTPEEIFHVMSILSRILR